MQVFACDHCRQAVYFENVVCENCGNALGFDPDALVMRTLYPAGDGKLATPNSGWEPKVYCANYDHDICNWLTTNTEPGEFCMSCALNDAIPDLTVPGNSERWFEVEKAKRRLLYTLRRLGLPIQTQNPNGQVPPLRFEILADAPTGHKNGVITLNLAEADPAFREKTREHFNEPYRTVLGHLRHESGHYYWMALVNNDRWLPRYRELFGDETADYGEALDAYHQSGPPADWGQSYISAYATAHPWEDWAESWAHYLHMVEALETAADYHISPRTPLSRTRRSWFASPYSDPYQARNANALVERWIPLALAMNSLNRSMGLIDFYPFVISPDAIAKLEFIHTLIRLMQK